MEIRWLEPCETGKAKALWERVFAEDAGRYADWYFERVFRPERCMGAFEGEELLSMASVGGYTLCIAGERFVSNFLQGVATAPKARGKGCAGGIVRGLLRHFYSEGSELSALKTFIPDFYRPFGYETYSWRQEHTVLAREEETGRIVARMDEVDDALICELNRRYCEFFKNRSGYVLRDAAYWRRLLEEYIYACEGALVLPGEGYAIAAKVEEALVAAECVCQSEEALASFAGAAQWMRAKSFVYGSLDGGRSDGMLRIVNVRRFLQRLRLGAGRCVIAVKDELFPENQGAWRIESDGAENRVERADAPADWECSIGELALLSMTGQGGARERSRRIREVFPRRETGIFEQY